MVEKICKNCGKPFITEDNRRRICDTCKEEYTKKHSVRYNGEKICKCCGKPFIAETSRKSICDTCRKANKEKHAKEYCVKYRKERKWVVTIDKEDNAILEKISDTTSMSKAKIIHVLLENFMENI
jgi:hypothetical protein